ncbi:MAG TPA: LLM class F420-dependent oxidoreductase [Acidimicrobiia bacterium]|nr:LLM class F420-dependent oxidoreductase [Acidimicrobiia bacterium]
MRFGTFAAQGWKGDQDGVPLEEQWQRTVDLATLAEEAGYDSLWVYDHFHSHPVVKQETVFEAWTLMASLAVATSRVRLGQMCTCALYRPPSYLAKVASSIDVISGGRLDVGIGAGWSQGEFEAYGYEFPSDGTRIDMLEETVQILKAMWTEDEATFVGDHYRVEGAINRPKPIQTPHPPLWIAGGGEKRTLRIVAEHADFANFGDGVAVFRRKSSVLAEHCEAVGRPYGQIGRTTHQMSVIGSDQADLARKLEIAARRRSCTPEEFRAEHFAATVAEAVDTMGEFASEGCTDVILYFYDMGESDSLEVFASDVMPQLR